jgi:hypothetical protein
MPGRQPPRRRPNERVCGKWATQRGRTSASRSYPGKETHPVNKGTGKPVIGEVESEAGRFTHGQVVARTWARRAHPSPHSADHARTVGHSALGSLRGHALNL